MTSVKFFAVSFSLFCGIIGLTANAAETYTVTTGVSTYGNATNVDGEFSDLSLYIIDKAKENLIAGNYPGDTANVKYEALVDKAKWSQTADGRWSFDVMFWDNCLKPDGSRGSVSSGVYTPFMTAKPAALADRQVLYKSLIDKFVNFSVQGLTPNFCTANVNASSSMASSVSSSMASSVSSSMASSVSSSMASSVSSSMASSVSSSVTSSVSSTGGSSVSSAGPTISCQLRFKIIKTMPLVGDMYAENSLFYVRKGTLATDPVTPNSYYHSGPDLGYTDYINLTDIVPNKTNQLRVILRMPGLYESNLVPASMISGIPPLEVARNFTCKTEGQKVSLTVALKAHPNQKFIYAQVSVELKQNGSAIMIPGKSVLVEAKPQSGIVAGGYPRGYADASGLAIIPVNSSGIDLSDMKFDVTTPDVGLPAVPVTVPAVDMTNGDVAQRVNISIKVSN